MSARLTLEDVEEAEGRIRPHLPPTPLRPSLAVPDADVRLKLECWQPTGSFKVRGALSLMTVLDEAERRAIKYELFPEISIGDAPVLN